MYSPFSPLPVAPKKASVPPGARAEISKGKFSPPVCSNTLSTKRPLLALRMARRNDSVCRSHFDRESFCSMTPNTAGSKARRSTKASARPREIKWLTRVGLLPMRITRAPWALANWAAGETRSLPAAHN